MEAHTPQALRAARSLRRDMSLPEVLLWQRLKGQPLGVKFRRQHPFGPFVLDFFCASKKTAIEIDGAAHDMGDRPARDFARDSCLRDHGFTVIRIPATVVLADVDAAAESIVAQCLAAPPPSAAGAADTSPKGGGFAGAST